MRFKEVSFILVLASLVLASCSSSEKRTKFSDKNMRIFLYHRTLKTNDYVRLQSALIKSDVWTVIDRRDGYNASGREQERIHRKDPDRFDDREKWTHIGKFYSVGAIVIGHTQCTYHKSIWKSKPVNRCYQALNLVDATTGEVIVGVDGHNEAQVGEQPDWEETVKKLIDVYPKYFTSQAISDRLERYKQESAEHSLRQKERQQ